jgi:hypothetical protein
LAVPDLTRNADIKLNNGVSLRRQLPGLLVARPDTASGPARQGRQATTALRFCFFDKGTRMIAERNGYQLLDLSPSPAWAEVWHLWTVMVPRRSITGRLVFGRIWRRRDGRRWIYKKFSEYELDIAK